MIEMKFYLEEKETGKSQILETFILDGTRNFQEVIEEQIKLKSNKGELNLSGNIIYTIKEIRYKQTEILYAD